MKTERKIKRIETKELNFLKPAIEIHPTTGIKLEFLIKQDAVAALVVNSEETEVYLVKQYRPGLAAEVYEIPAGLIDEGEEPLQACLREVREECGYQAKDLQILYQPEEALATTPGYSEEKISFFLFKLKQDSQQLALQLDHGEDLVGGWFPLESLSPFQKPEQLFDLKTSYAYLLWQDYINKKKI